MKKKILLSSILVIALCVSLIAGSTFALFTSESKFDISVTSGNVDIVATVDSVTLYSAVATDGNAEDAYLIDENNANYVHQKQNDGYFLNRGTATYANGLVEIVRITPGDRVDIDIAIDNYSNVAFSYRYKVAVKEGSATKLGEAVVLSYDGASFDGISTWTSDWITVAGNDDGSITPIGNKIISLELPVYVGNDYKSDLANNDTKSVTYVVTVEAVQGNAVKGADQLDYIQ